jgi:FkbM family methyltransferase
VYPDSDSGLENIYTVNVDYWENAFIRSQLKPGDFIVDAGCNVGNRTLVLSDIIGGALLLDANEACLKRLRDNFLLNDGINLTNYHMVNKAVGAELKRVQFTNLGGTSCWNRIYEGPDSGDVHSRIVEMTTVDNEMAKLRNPQCSFMKFDLEGHDYCGLLGAKKTLKTDSMKLVQFERWANVDVRPIEDFFDSISWFIFALDANGKPTLDRKVITTALNLFATKSSLLRQILPNG